MTGFVPPSFKMDACVEIATSSYPIHRLDNIGVESHDLSGLMTLPSLWSAEPEYKA